MHSYEGPATIVVDDGRPPLEVTVIIDDVTRSSWVGIIQLLKGAHPRETAGSETGPGSDAEVQVILRGGPTLGAAARMVVPAEGLPTLRGRDRFASAPATPRRGQRPDDPEGPEAEHCGAGTPTP